jgi:chromosome segregation ATPase
MNPIQKLRTALATRAESATEKYWRLANDVARGKPAVDESKAEQVLRDSGKSVDDLEAAVARLTELREKRGAAAELQQALRELEARQRAITAADERRIAAFEAANREAVKLEAERNAQQVRVQSLSADAERCERLQRELVAEGMPPQLAEVATR